MTRLLTIFTAAAFALLALAGPALGSPAVKLDFDCYRSGQAATAMISDFDPNTDLSMSVGTHALGATQTDDQGDVSFDFTAPKLAAGKALLKTRLTAQDENGLIAEDVFNVVPLTLFVTPKRAAAKRKVTFSFGGFVERTSIYEHIVYKGKAIKTTLFGTPRAPCGSLKRTVTQLPLKTPKPGAYTLQFDLEAGYSADARPAVRTSVRVPKPKRR